MSLSLNSRLAAVKLFVCDVDGILTDGTLIIGRDGEQKTFYIPDGLGMRLLQRSGIKTAWVSHRPSPATARRAEELQVDFLHQKEGSKMVAVNGILTQTGLDWSEVCFMGDDLVDLGVLKRVGVAAVVPTAIDEAKALAHYITTAQAGRGAVREVIEMLLKAQNKWLPLVERYSV